MAKPKERAAVPEIHPFPSGLGDAEPAQCHARYGRKGVSRLNHGTRRNKGISCSHFFLFFPKERKKKTPNPRHLIGRHIHLPTASQAIHHLDKIQFHIEIQLDFQMQIRGEEQHMVEVSSIFPN